MQDRRLTTRHRQLLLDDDTFATTLLLIVLDAYPEMLSPDDGEEPGWHPATLREQLRRDYAADVSRLALDKIMVGLRIVTTNEFHRDLSRFIASCNVLSGTELGEDFDPADAGELLWGMTEATLLWPSQEDDGDETRFDPQIVAYVAETLKEEGVLDPPDLLRIAGGQPQPSESFVDDDPALLAGAWEIQQGRKTELLNLVHVRLDELAEELSDLPLRRGSTQALVQLLRRKSAQTPSPTAE